MPDEIEGLRAFAVRVESYVGGRYPEEPRAVELGGRRLAVSEVVARWGEDDRLGWRLRLEDGRTVLLYYVPEYDLWSVVDPA